MKIGGKKIEVKPASEMIVFPREGDTVIAIRANAVMDRTEFDRLVPDPKPGKKRIKGGQVVDDFENARYIAAFKEKGKKFGQWLVVNSLCGVDKETQEDSPIEWEIVDRSNPSTWSLWEKELSESSFSDMERKKIYNLVMEVNCVNEDRLEEARKSFLTPRETDEELSSNSQTDEPQDTQSGEPASDSESDLQESQPVGTSSTKP